MKYQNILPFVCFVFLFAVLPVQAKAELSISVVDMHKIMSDSKAAKSIKDQVKSKRDAFVKEVKATEEDFRKDQKQLEADKETLSKEDLMKRFRALEEKGIEARKKLQQQQQKLDEAYNRAMANLSQEIFNVCKKIADEKKIDLIITKDNIIVGNNALDITPEVLAALDKTLPKLALEVK